MDIKDVSAEISRSSQNERTDPSRLGRAKASTIKAEGQKDSFENSGRLGKVRTLIDSLVESPETRSDAIARGKQLLASGELDSYESASKAAQGFLVEGGGFLG